MRQGFAPIQSERKAPRVTPGIQKKLMSVAQPKDFQRGASVGSTKTSQDEAKIPATSIDQYARRGGSCC